jgi:aspartate kinase
MSVPITIMKFGGTSVSDSSAFESVAGIVQAQVEDGHQVVVVVSAMSGVTNALASSLRLAAQGAIDSAAQLLDDFCDRHLQVAEHLLSPQRRSTYSATLMSSRAELDELLVTAPVEHGPAMLDRVLSYGEQLSAMLLAPVLCESGLRSDYLDARRCIVTNDVYGSATPRMGETMHQTKLEIGPLLEASCIPVLGGFIGATVDGTPTTLGRNGSDYTASLVGAALGAFEIQIWTDVAGVLTADPRLVDNALPIEQLSYSEAAELSNFGAKVVYPKAIQCAAVKQIPLRICSSYAPDEGSTIISSVTKSTPGIFKSIARKTELMLVRVSSCDSLLTSRLNNLVAIVEQYRSNIDLVDISEHSVSIVMRADGCYRIIEELRQLGSVESVRDRALVCVIGEGLGDSPGSASRIFGALADVRVDLISQGRCGSSLVFLVGEEESEEIVQRLHRLFFSTVETEDSVVGSQLLTQPEVLAGSRV